MAVNPQRSCPRRFVIVYDQRAESCIIAAAPLNEIQTQRRRKNNIIAVVAGQRVTAVGTIIKASTSVARARALRTWRVPYSWHNIWPVLYYCAYNI